MKANFYKVIRKRNCNHLRAPPVDSVKLVAELVLKAQRGEFPQKQIRHYLSTCSIIPCIQISLLCDSPPRPSLHFFLHRSRDSTGRFSIWRRSQAMLAARTQPALTVTMHASSFAMVKNSSCSLTAVVHLDARPRARRTRSVFEQQVGHYLLCGHWIC